LTKIINELNYKFFARREGKSKRKIETIDFIIDNYSLLDLFINEDGGHNDFMGCFSKGWDKLNECSKNKLLLKMQPETIDGRMALYVCPECADIGCGAYCCKIEKTDDFYIWKDFAYENNYEDARIINNIRPFYFNKIAYEEIILKLSSI
jgi:hypothetical protein